MSIQFNQVSKSFGPKNILNQVSFDVPVGEILFIIGKSGVGKSVTLKTIVGMLRPDRGNVLIDGDDVTKMDIEGLSKIRRKCGMVFQQPALLDSLNVYQNVSFGLRTPQYINEKGELTEVQIRERVLEKLALVNLGEDIFEKFPPQISFGMQKRVSLARTLAPEPIYLLFDEPTTGLDPITTNAVNALIKDLSEKLKVTSLVVSHDMGCALDIADKILILEDSKILAHDTVDKIKSSTEPLIVDFLEEILAQKESRKGGAKK